MPAPRNRIPAGSDSIASEVTPEERVIYQFLNRLDNADFDLTDLETDFVGDLIDHPRPLTQAQRTKCDQLRTNYEGCL